MPKKIKFFTTILLTVFLTTVVLPAVVQPTPALAANGLTFPDECRVTIGEYTQGLGGFLSTALIGALPFLGVDIVIGLLEQIPIAGGVFQPIGQITDIIRDFYTSTVIWGIIASALNFFAGSLLEVALGLNLELTRNTITDPTGFINFGYQFILSITRIFFVIALIIMGFMTMFRQQHYSAQKNLPRLIAAVLLINFTLYAVSLLINTGTGLTLAMFNLNNQMKPCPQRFVAQFNVVKLQPNIENYLEKSAIQTEEVPAAVKEYQKSEEYDQAKTALESEEVQEQLTWGQRILLGVTEGLIQPTINWLTGTTNKIFISQLSVVIASIFSLIGTLTTLALVLFLLVRYFALSLLVVFAPAIWISFVFPNMKIPAIGNIWSNWWETFLKWVLFGPIIIFFIAITSAYLNQINLNDPTEGGILRALAQLLLAALFSAGGLYAASKISGVGAGLVMGGVGLAAGLAMQKTQGFFMRSQAGMARWAEGRFQPGSLQDRIFRRAASSAVGRMGGAAALSGIGSAVGLKLPKQESLTLGAFREKAIKEEQERIKGATSKELIAEFYKARASRHAPRLTAILQELNKRGDLPDLGLDQIFGPQNKKAFDTYGQDFSAIEKSLGINEKIWRAVKAGDAAAAKEEYKKFFAGLSDAAMAKINFDDIYTEKPYGLTGSPRDILQESSTYGIVKNNVGNLRKPLTKVKAKNFDWVLSAAHRVRTDLMTTDPTLARRIMNVIIKTQNKRLAGDLPEPSSGTS